MIDCVAAIATRKGIVKSTLEPTSSNLKKKGKNNLYYCIFIIYFFFKIFFDIIFYLTNYDEKYFECNNVIH